MKLSVIVPSYRQRATIVAELRALENFLAGLTPDHEIILVVDGNEDGTLEELLGHDWFPSLRVACFPKNQGKGLAVRHGLTLARGELIATLDSGGELDPTELPRFIAAQTLYAADVVIGSKRHPLSEVSYPLRRRFYSRLYQLLIRALFQLRVRDTQVGMKLIRREVRDAVLPRLLVKAYAFDLEFLVVAHRLGFRRIVEAPIRLRYAFSSSVNRRAVVRVLWDTFAVFYRLRLRRWYDTPRPLTPLPRAETVVLPAVAVPETLLTARAVATTVVE